MTGVNDLFRRLVGCYGASLVFHALLGIIVAIYTVVPKPEPIEKAETIFIDTALSGLPHGNGSVQSEPAEETAAATLTELPKKASKQNPIPAPAAVKEKVVQEPPVVIKMPSKPKIKVADSTVTPTKPAAAKTSSKPNTRVQSLPAKSAVPLSPARPVHASKEPTPQPVAPEESQQEMTATPIADIAENSEESEARHFEETMHEEPQLSPEQPTEQPQVTAALTQTELERNAAPVQESPPQQPPLQPQPEPEPTQQMAQTAPPPQESSGKTSPQTTSGTSSPGSATVEGLREASELAEASGNRPPQYPERDRLMRNQGTVVLIAYVNNDGTVSQVQLERNTPSSTLNMSALNAMKRWLFMPGQAGWVRKGFTFSLGTTTEELPARLRR